jgi:hypothetical protein
MGGGSPAEGRRQRAGARSAPIAVIAGIAVILPQKAKTGLSGDPGIARDQKSKTVNHKGHEGTQRKSFEPYANLEWVWDEVA